MNFEKLGDEMKAFEDAYRTYLPSDGCLVVRVDGRAFHTYTSVRDRPYDLTVANAMDIAAKQLCKDFQGVKFAYGQSDEYSFIATKDRPESELWFGGNLQKIVSVAASVFTQAFNSFVPSDPNAQFDARAFVIPKDEVLKYCIWRQLDCKRNAISMAAQAHFSHKELNCKSSTDKLQMLLDIGQDFTKLPREFRMGRVVFKKYWLETGTLMCNPPKPYSVMRCGWDRGPAEGFQQGYIDRLCRNYE